MSPLRSEQLFRSRSANSNKFHVVTRFENRDVIIERPEPRSNDAYFCFRHGVF